MEELVSSPFCSCINAGRRKFSHWAKGCNWLIARGAEAEATEADFPVLEAGSEVWAGCVVGGGGAREQGTGSFLACPWLLVFPWHLLEFFLVCLCIIPTFAMKSTWLSLCVYLLKCFLFYKDTSPIGTETVPQGHLIVQQHINCYYLSKRGHILRLWELGLQCSSHRQHYSTQAAGL